MLKLLVKLSTCFILGLLFLAVYYVLNSRVDQGNIEIPRTQALLNAVLTKLEECNSTNGNYPEEASALDECVLGDDKKPIIDLWGSRLEYRLLGDKIVVYSLGPNLIDDFASLDDIVSVKKLPSTK